MGSEALPVGVSLTVPGQQGKSHVWWRTLAKAENLPGPRCGWAIFAHPINHTAPVNDNQ